MKKKSLAAAISQALALASTAALSSPTNTREIAQDDAVTTVNVQVQVRTEKWHFIAGLNNATDEEYPIAGNSSLTTGSGYAEIAYSSPQVWFATIEYDF